MAYIPPLNGGRLNASIGGNTAGVNTIISTGTMVLAGGNNITLSQNGSAITISGANAPSGSINFSAGTTSANLASVTFANSGNVSFGLSNSALTASYSQTNQTANMVSINGSTGDISFTTGGNVSLGGNASAVTASYSQTVQTQNIIQAMVGGTATSTANSGTVNFANSNGVTFGMSGNTMTASIAAAGGGVAISGGGTSYSTGTVNLSAAGGALTIASGANQSLNFSVPATSSLSGTGAISMTTNGSTISIGAPVASSLSATGAINISSSGNTISIGAPLNGTISNWEPYPIQMASLVNNSLNSSNGMVGFYKLAPEAYVNASQLMQLVSISLSSASNSSHAGAISLGAGIYSANGSTLSLLTQSSGTTFYRWTNTSNNSFNSVSGLRGLSLPINIAMAPGNYWLGLWSQTASTNTNWFSASQMALQFTANSSLSYAGILGQAPAATQGIQEGVGMYSSTTAALPTSMPMSQISQSALSNVSIPYVVFKNQTW